VKALTSFSKKKKNFDLLTFFTSRASESRLPECWNPLSVSQTLPKP